MIMEDTTNDRPNGTPSADSGATVPEGPHRTIYLVMEYVNGDIEIVRAYTTWDAARADDACDVIEPVKLFGEESR